jgi:hypothetical protein
MFLNFRNMATGRKKLQEALTSIFFSGFCASGFLGRVTVSTPFLKLASILSASTPSGNWKRRSKEPKWRSGIVGLVATLSARQAPGFGWSLLSALVAVIAGGVLLWNLLQGLVTLTYVLTPFSLSTAF